MPLHARALGALACAIVFVLTPAPTLAAESAAALPVVKQAAQTQVLAGHPVAFALTKALTADTSVSVVQAAPARLPATRHASYYAGRGAQALARLALGADAVIGLRSIWPDDVLYPLSRQSNIRIVEIDAARPVDRALPGIALQPNSDASSYPWLSPVNLGRMADIIAADLGRLAPDAQAALQSNLARIKHGLVEASAAAEASLAAVDNVTVVSLSDRLDYLIASLNLDLAQREIRSDAEWTEDAIGQLTADLKANDVAVVLHHREPPAALRDAIDANGVRVLVLDTDGADPVSQLHETLQTLVKAFEAHSQKT
ncbi:metal ABC transporter substrate-binding protein [Allopusillimonas ginsengisoli]|nr:metal ABC transporter substrate-binding protein [Allopusillimonas ginsengisoli]